MFYDDGTRVYGGAWGSYDGGTGVYRADAPTISCDDGTCVNGGACGRYGNGTSCDDGTRVNGGACGSNDNGTGIYRTDAPTTSCDDGTRIYGSAGGSNDWICYPMQDRYYSLRMVLSIHFLMQAIDCFLYSLEPTFPRAARDDGNLLHFLLFSFP